MLPQLLASAPHPLSLSVHKSFQHPLTLPPLLLLLLLLLLRLRLRRCRFAAVIADAAAHACVDVAAAATAAAAAAIDAATAAAATATAPVVKAVTDAAAFSNRFLLALTVNFPADFTNSFLTVLLEIPAVFFSLSPRTHPAYCIRVVF